MPNLKTYDIFISHAWKYGGNYKNLTDLLDDANYFIYRNYSAPKDKPLQNLDSTDPNTVKEIKSAIDRKIKNVNIVVVISGMYAAYSRWMSYEIESANKFHKPIIAIRPRGNQRISREVSSNSLEIVNWNTNSIVSAIRKHSL